MVYRTTRREVNVLIRNSAVLRLSGLYVSVPFHYYIVIYMTAFHRRVCCETIQCNKRELNYTIKHIRLLQKNIPKN